MIRRFLASSDGAVAVSTAVLLILLIGITGLGAEASLWFQTKRAMQGAADAAANSAAYALPGAGGSSCTSGSACTWAPGLHGLAVAAENGWQRTGTNGITVQVVSPPTKSGSPFLGNANAVEVWITQTQPSILFGAVGNILAPTIGAYAIAAASTVTAGANGCVLALANDPAAVQVSGNGDLAANCGLFIDGGIKQNISATPRGDVTFNGAPSKIHVTSLTVAASSSSCPGSHCYQFSPSTTLLPASAVKTSTGTADPYASRTFTRPTGATVATVVATGSGYTNGTRTFKVVGGTGIPATFTAKVTAGKVGTPITIVDPGAYTVAPTNPVSVTDTGGGSGSGATFTLTTVAGACLAWDSAPIAGRAYCSINFSSGTTTFPSGIYYVEGGDSSCAGFCLPSGTALSASGGVTFVLTNGTGAKANSYAIITMSSGSFGTTANPFTAPAAAINANGSACIGTCANTTQGLVFFQDRNATASTANATSGSTVSTFSGNGSRTIYGVIYLPNQTFAQSGNGQISGNCVGLVAKYINVAGTPSFSNGCLPGTGIGPIGGTTTTKSTLSE